MPKATFSLASSALDEAAEARGSWFDQCLPPGVYPGKIAQFRLGVAGADKHPALSGVVEVVAPKGHEKEKYNGTGATFQLNVTDQGGPWVRQLLDALGVTPAQFLKSTITDGEKPKANITKIGTTKITGENMVMIQSKIEVYEGEDRARVRNFMPFEDDDDATDVEADETEEEEELEEAEETDSDESEEEEAEEETEESGVEDASEEDETYSDSELREFTLEELVDLAKADFEITKRFRKGTSDDDKIEAYVKAIHEAQGTTPEAGEEEEAEEEAEEEEVEADETEEEEEEAEFAYSDAELAKMDLPALKTLARSEFKVKIMKGMSREKIVQAMKDAPPF